MEPLPTQQTALPDATCTTNGAVSTAGVPPANVGAVVSPLAVPWLRHDNFPTIKKVCSESGLPQAKRASVVRVLQELKKGRTHIDQQLTHLETQLLHVSDFLSGATDKLEFAQDESAMSAAEDSVDGGAQATANGKQATERMGKGESSSTSDKTNPLNPIATLVEEDLASDAPCTTVGLWRYLSVYSFLKTVTLEDMQEALLLEDFTAVEATEVNDDDGSPADRVRDYESVNGLPSLDALPTKEENGGGSVDHARVNELLKMRLVAAMLPQPASPESLKKENGHCVEPAEDAAMKDNGDGDVDMSSWDHEPPIKAASSSRAFQQLRDIGLLEAEPEEVAHSLAHPQDDEVSCEIRMLQDELVRQVRRNNECKRSLRRDLERLKPWLTHDEEYQQIETKFQKMWHRKKELQRKKKHKEKKQQRKEASFKSAFAVPPPPQQC